MLGGLNPKKMQALMKQMGMSQDEIPASKVTIEKTDGSKIVIENPSVIKIQIQGKESFQVSGDTRESVGISGEDVQTVMKETNSTEEQARSALEKTQDLAEAILELSK